MLISRIYILCGICLAGADSAASNATAPQSVRVPIDQRFSADLEALAKKCESLGLNEQAQLTRSWMLDRDPERQYVFLSDHVDSTKPPSAAPELIRFWHKHFCAARDKYADELFDLAKRLVEENQQTKAYQLLHEVLRNSPDHAEARRILGYRKQLGRWQRESGGISSRSARVAHPLFGWAPRRYWRVETPHFEITTNHSVKEGQQLGSQLELLHDVWRQVFYRFWAGERDLAAAVADEGRTRQLTKKHQVVLFHDRDEYVTQMKKYVPGIEVSEGFYADQRRTSYFYAGNEDALAIWFHEVTHQLFQELGPGIPDIGLKDNYWIIEAVALYMESLVPHDGYVTLGGFDASRLQYARYRALNHRFYLPLVELIPMGRDEMQKDERLRRLYSQSAGLGHFLMDYQSGRFRDAAVSYLQIVYAGRERNDTLEKLAGVTLSELDKAYHEFLDVTDAQVVRYLRPLDSLTKLALGHTSITDAGLKQLGEATKLEWLDLADTNVTDEGIRYLSNSGDLIQLNLEGTRISNDSLKVVGELKQIEQLDLSRTSITDEGLPSVATLSKLKELWLTGTSVTDAGLESLESLKGLETLDTSGTRVTAAGLEQLRRVLPKLKN